MTGSVARERYQLSKRSTYSPTIFSTAGIASRRNSSRSFTTDLRPSTSTQRDVVDLCHRWIDVARNGDIHDKERPLRTQCHRAGYALFVEDEIGCAG